ncbi:rho-related GTP-binding protein RhoG-like isoform X2 [Argiope bruennichi]|uniref:rho-related GTP-binding protein RhoG-like isoform X2 n=1 Tax=Argiope bruennichi TaxID=94029 RepID=UPI00249513AD|nr:rho-related GTP-binding protein RhoG-like isoform X2 [Argiope bruennichi]
MSPKKETIKKIKCHVVGDIGIGKTSLLLAYEKKRFPTEIELLLTCFPYPRFANTVVKYESSDVYLWDNMEYDEFTELRTLGYLDTHVFIICFSVVLPSSAESIKEQEGMQDLVKEVVLVARTAPKKK